MELGYAGKGVKSFLTNAIDWLRDAFARLLGKKKNEPTTKITDTREMQHGAPLDPVNPSNVAQYKDGKAPKKQIGKTEKQDPVQPSQAAVSDLDLQITGLKNEIAAAERGDIRMTPEGLAYRKAQLENLM